MELAANYDFHKSSQMLDMQFKFDNDVVVGLIELIRKV
jgi:hypothetical protein